MDFGDFWIVEYSRSDNTDSTSNDPILDHHSAANCHLPLGTSACKFECRRFVVFHVFSLYSFDSYLPKHSSTVACFKHYLLYLYNKIYIVFILRENYFSALNISQVHEIRGR